MKQKAFLFALAALAFTGCDKSETETVAPAAAKNVSDINVNCQRELRYYYPMNCVDHTYTNDYAYGPYNINTYTISTATPRRFFAKYSMVLCSSMYSADFFVFTLVKPDGSEVSIGTMYSNTPVPYGGLYYNIPLEYYSNDIYTYAKDAQPGNYFLKLKYGIGTPANPIEYREITSNPIVFTEGQDS